LPTTGECLLAARYYRFSDKESAMNCPRHLREVANKEALKEKEEREEIEFLLAGSRVDEEYLS
jgi:hypothetical protein